MTGFVSLPPKGPGAPPAADDTTTLGSFWPSLSIAAARAILRVPTDVTDQRLRDALQAAALETMRELAPWRAEQTAITLGEVPADQIDGESVKVVLFRRAVHALAGADLAELQRRLDAAGAADARLTLSETTVDDHRRNARWAIADLIGAGRATVELI